VASSTQNLYLTIILAILVVVAMAMAFKGFLVRPASLLCNIETTTARLDNEYTERTRTQRGITTTSYQISYTFEVDGKRYNGQCPIGDAPRQEMTVQYDRRNPGVNGMELSGHAYIDLGIFGFLVVVFLGCVVVIIRHYRSG